MIEAMRAQTEANAITPEYLGNILQMIVNFVKSLLLVPEEDVINVTSMVQDALSTANAAVATANNALTTARGMLLNLLQAVCGTDAVALSIGQQGGTTLTLNLTAANENAAGVMSAAQAVSLAQAVLDITANKVSFLTVTPGTTSASLKITFGTGNKSVTLPAATTSKAGLMTAADKQALADKANDADVAKLDATGHLSWAHCPVVVLDYMKGETPIETPNGHAYYDIDMGKIYCWMNNGADAVELGVPSQNVYYCHRDTNVLYRWTGSKFEPINANPKAGMLVQEVRCSNRTQKRYDIPSGPLCILKPSTDTVNFNLLPSEDGNGAIHRIVLEASDVGDLVDGTTTGLKWPASLIWEDGTRPVVQDVDSGEGVMVIIYNSRYAHFIAYR